MVTSTNLARHWNVSLSQCHRKLADIIERENLNLSADECAVNTVRSIHRRIRQLAEDGTPINAKRPGRKFKTEMS